MKVEKYITTQFGILKTLFSKELVNQYLINLINTTKDQGFIDTNSIINNFDWDEPCLKAKESFVCWCTINDIVIHYKPMRYTGTLCPSKIKKVLNKEIEIFKKEHPELFI